MDHEMKQLLNFGLEFQPLPILGCFFSHKITSIFNFDYSD